jgi:hypothetical protein
MRARRWGIQIESRDTCLLSVVGGMVRGRLGKFVDLGIPNHAVEVVIHEIPKSHWGIAGEPASERLKDESPPQ